MIRGCGYSTSKPRYPDTSTSALAWMIAAMATSPVMLSGAGVGFGFRWITRLPLLVKISTQHSYSENDAAVVNAEWGIHTICAPEEGGNHPISGDQAMANGRPESTAFMAAANGARCIWPWTPPRLTSAPWNSPPSSAGDSPILPELLDQIPEVEEIGTVTADGAYDTRRCHTAIIDRQATQSSQSAKTG